MPSSLENLQPGCFAIVMATGIVALAAHFEIYTHFLAPGLAGLSVAILVWLCLMTLARAIRFSDQFFADFKDFQRGPGFFAFVAAAAVVGSQAVVIFELPALALVFWLVALPLWACFMYAIFTEFTVNEHKPSFEEGINGGWLISVVATQGVADLGARLSVRYSAYQNEILFLSLTMWLAGGMLYVWLISLIFYRFTFFRFRPKDFLPPFWINMGAMAISTLAGTTLAAQAAHAQFLEDLLPFLKGFTIFFWAAATWWIPMLAILAFWQHVIKKSAPSYSFLYWDIVFPIGMYTVSSYRLSQVMDLPFLMRISRILVYIALISWLATFSAMIRSGLRPLRLPERTRSRV